MNTTAELDRCVRALSAARLRHTSEEELQQGVQLILARAGIEAVREHDFGAKGRIDVWCPAIEVGIECKTAGGPAAVLKQIMGYAEVEAVAGLIVVTSRLQLAQSIPKTLRDKPVRVVALWSSSF